MLYVKPLSEEEQLTLREMSKYHPLPWTRARAQAVLLSAQRRSIKDLTAIHEVSRQTISIWLKAWERDGLLGLVDQPRAGRPRKLSESEQTQVLDWLEREPRSIKQIQAQVQAQFGKAVSTKTLKRLIRERQWRWKRVRQSLADKREAQAVAASQARLAHWQAQEAAGEIERYYFDESGFTLEPCVPYAWQPTGQTLEVPCARSRRLNVLGFMNRDSQVRSYVFEGCVDSAVVVRCIDEFTQYRRKPVVMVMDNSPLHTSDEFEQQLARWAAKGVTIECIAPYAPELNLIEILWRKIKYEWLPFCAYNSFAHLREHLFKVLKNIGTQYKIAFS